MELLQAKIRCVRHIADTGWFKPGRNLTFFSGENSEVLSRLFKGLEAVHPLYDVQQRVPFADHPKTWTQGNYNRRVIAEKKTAACAVFSSDPEHVRVLAQLDDSLFETDRIELGRRLDYSRWISFVELSESARWSDIHYDMNRLLEIKNNHLSGNSDQSDIFIISCKKNDRIKGELAEQCLAWLHQNEELLREKNESVFKECFYKVNLNERYKLARRTVTEELPPIIRLYPELTLQDKYTFTEIYDAGPLSDPITNLLHRICHRYGITSSSTDSMAALQERIALLSSQDVMGLNSIALTIDRGGVVPRFNNGKSSSEGSRRIHCISFVAFLVRILWDGLPFFLFDQYDKGLNREEKDEFVLLCEKIGSHKQVMVTLDRREKLFDCKDFVLLHVDSEGVVR